MLERRFQQIPFFREFTEEDLSMLLRYAVERQFGTDEVIFSQGDPGRELYVILSGKVRFEHTAAGSETRVLSHAEFGSLFGELAFLQPQARTASAVADVITSLLIFQKSDIQKLLDLYPTLAAAFYYAIALELARRLRESMA